MKKRDVKEYFELEQVLGKSKDLDKAFLEVMKKKERNQLLNDIHESTETLKAILEKLNEIQRLLVDRLR